MQYFSIAVYGDFRFKTPKKSHKTPLKFQESIMKIKMLKSVLVNKIILIILDKSIMTISELFCT